MNDMAGLEAIYVGKIYAPVQLLSLYSKIDALDIHYSVDEDKKSGCSIIVKEEDARCVENVIEQWREEDIKALRDMKLDHVVYLRRNSIITADQLKEAVLPT